MLLRRASWQIKAPHATILDTETTSPALNISQAASGHVQVPSAFDGTSFTYLSSPTDDGTFQSVRDGAGNAVTTTIAASQDFSIPESVMGARFLKLVSSDAQSSGDCDLIISLKG